MCLNPSTCRWVSLPWSLQLSLLLILFESASPARTALTGQSAPAAPAALLPQALSKGTTCLAAAVQKSEPVCGILELGSVTCKREKRLYLSHNSIVDLKIKIFFFLELIWSVLTSTCMHTTQQIMFFNTDNLYICTCIVNAFGMVLSVAL